MTFRFDPLAFEGTAEYYALARRPLLGLAG